MQKLRLIFLLLGLVENLLEALLLRWRSLQAEGEQIASKVASDPCAVGVHDADQFWVLDLPLFECLFLFGGHFVDRSEYPAIAFIEKVNVPGNHLDQSELSHGQVLCAAHVGY